MIDSIQGVAAQQAWQAQPNTALGQVADITVDTLLKMALETEQTLQEATQKLSEKRALMLGEGNELRTKGEAIDAQPAGTLYSVLCRVSALARTTNNIAIKL